MATNELLADKLKAGHRRMITAKVNCSPSMVTEVLQGKKSNTTRTGKAIYRMAQAIIKNDSKLDKELNKIKNQINNDNN